MNFPRHWAKAAANRFQCWRWSDVSVEDARTKAETAVRALAERFKTTEQLPAQDHYGYPDRPMREEVLREFRNGRIAHRRTLEGVGAGGAERQGRRGGRVEDVQNRLGRLPVGLGAEEEQGREEENRSS